MKQSYNVAVVILLFASGRVFDVTNIDFLCCDSALLMLRRNVRWEVLIRHPGASGAEVFKS